MTPGHDIRERYPDRTAIVRRYLKDAFGAALAEGEDFGHDTLWFRTPSGRLVVVPEEVLEDLDSDALYSVLDFTNLAERALRLGSGQRVMLTHSGIA